jgi:hypothetical protein
VEKTFALVRRSIVATQTMRPVQLGLTLVALIFVTQRLSHIGWSGIAQALPRTPLFYLIFAVNYAVLPLSEFTLYRRLLGCRRDALPILFRKRVFNEALLDYSGEFLFYAWARGKIGDSLSDYGTKIGAVVRDVVVLSGMASNVFTLVLLAVAAATGQLRTLMATSVTLRVVTEAAIPAMGLLLAFGTTYLRMLSASRRDLGFILAVHSIRLVANLTLQVGLWLSVFPRVSLDRWLILVSAWMVVTRLPFLPNRDLVLMSLGIAFAGTIGAPPEAIAGMFVAAATLALAAHATVLLATMRAPSVTAGAHG